MKEILPQVFGAFEARFDYLEKGLKEAAVEMRGQATAIRELTAKLENKER